MHLNPMRPSVRMSPTPATPTTREENTRGITVIRRSRRKSSPMGSVTCETVQTIRGSSPPQKAFTVIPANAPIIRPSRMRVWRGMRRFSRVLVVAASRDDFFAGFVGYFGDHRRLTARLRGADRQRDFRARLQGLFRLRLAPAVADHVRGIR